MKEILINKTSGTTDPVLTGAIADVQSLRTGLEGYLLLINNNVEFIN